jgi:hypothetical protein
MVAVVLNIGLRRGEVFKLTWVKVNFHAAVPGAAHRARLGILGEQRLDLRAHDAEVVGVGR